MSHPDLFWKCDEHRCTEMLGSTHHVDTHVPFCIKAWPEAPRTQGASSQNMIAHASITGHLQACAGDRPLGLEVDMVQVCLAGMRMEARLTHTCFMSRLLHSLPPSCRCSKTWCHMCDRCRISTTHHATFQDDLLMPMACHLMLSEERRHSCCMFAGMQSQTASGPPASPKLSMSYPARKDAFM